MSMLSTRLAPVVNKAHAYVWASFDYCPTFVWERNSFGMQSIPMNRRRAWRHRSSVAFVWQIRNWGP